VTLPRLVCTAAGYSKTTRAFVEANRNQLAATRFPSATQLFIYTSMAAAAGEKYTVCTGIVILSSLVVKFRTTDRKPSGSYHFTQL
jgi:hypothetical protein